MTIVIDRYSTTDGKTATIEMQKDSKLYYVTVYGMHDGIPVLEYKRDFITLQSAARTIKRRYPGISKAEV